MLVVEAVQVQRLIPIASQKECEYQEMTVSREEHRASPVTEERDDRLAPPTRKTPPKRSYTRRRAGTDTIPGQSGMSPADLDECVPLDAPSPSAGPTAPPTIVEQSSPFRGRGEPEAGAAVESSPRIAAHRSEPSGTLPIQQSPFHPSAVARGRSVPKTVPLAPAAAAPGSRRIQPTVVERPAFGTAAELDDFQLALARTGSAPGLARSPFAAGKSSESASISKPTTDGPVPTMQAGLSAWGSRTDELPPRALDNETSQRFSTAKKQIAKTKQLDPAEVRAEVDRRYAPGDRAALPELEELRRELARPVEKRTPRWVVGVAVGAAILAVFCVVLIGWVLAG